MTQNTLSRKNYAKLVRSALRQLYDAQALERHPLANLMSEPGTPAVEAAQHLRRLLLDGVAALRPSANVPAGSPDRRAYRILELRYIEGATASEAMEALALQKSQYFRDQARALDRVSSELWAIYQHASADWAAVMESPEEIAEVEDMVDDEVERLQMGAVWEALDASLVLNDLRELIGRLGQAQGITITVGDTSPIPVAHASRVLLRQAILNVLTSAMEQCPHCSLSIACVREALAVGFVIRSDGPQPVIEPSASDQAPAPPQRLETSRRLMLLMHGSLQLQTLPGSPWEARLLWPARMRNRLLVIDDNQGFCDLFTRYLDGHAWRVIGASNVADARRIIASHEPTVITMDVLMPEQDGWDLLMALKTDPTTRHIPVIVCSVLQEPQLAYALGASAYLPKPVSERSLLQALQPWMTPNPALDATLPG